MKKTLKRILTLTLSLLVIVTLVGCQSNTDNEESEESNETEQTTPVNPDGKSLIVYFSWGGNTKEVATSLQSITGSDIFEIVPSTPYSDDYDEVVDFAQEEQADDARPEIKDTIDNIADYDVIYVGYPNWWGDMPMILYTFFDNYDLSGKTIAPFATSSSSGLSDTVDTIKELEGQATVTEGLSIYESELDDREDMISSWLSDMGLQ